jgi:Carbohydrate-binding module 48 (Isoamylase N-terminal domain)
MNRGLGCSFTERADKSGLMTPKNVAEQHRAKDLASASETGNVRSGSPLPYGAHQRGDGVNFALFSRHADRARLELYRSPDDSAAYKAIDLDPVRNRTGDVWHIRVRGLHPANCTPIGSTGHISRPKATASTHASYFWIRMRGQSPASPNGSFRTPEATTPAVGSRICPFRPLTTPTPRRSASSTITILIGKVTSLRGIRLQKRSSVKLTCVVAHFIRVPG